MRFLGIIAALVPLVIALLALTVAWGGLWNLVTDLDESPEYVYLLAAVAGFAMAALGTATAAYILVRAFRRL